MKYAIKNENGEFACSLHADGSIKTASKQVERAMLFPMHKAALTALIFRDRALKNYAMPNVSCEIVGVMEVTKLDTVEL